MSGGSRVNWAEARAKVERIREQVETAGERSPEERERILRQRAERLAQPAAEPREDSGTALVIVAVGAERFAIPLEGALEVIRNPRCAPVPLAPPALAGVIQVRSEIRPVFHLSRAVNLPDASGDDAVVLLVRRGQFEAGLRVDRIEDIRPDPGAGRRPAPAGMPHVLWMTADLIPVLDPDRIFPEEMS
jgi:chemotaxis signal transduction protein